LTVRTARSRRTCGVRRATATLARAVLAAGALAPGLAAQPSGRALWLWERETFEALEQANARTALLEFLARHRVSTVYLYADSWRGRNPIAQDPARYRTLLAELRARGVEPYALLGSAPLDTPTYILPENRLLAEAMLARVLDYNAAAAPGERFAGLNIDIEPYLLDDWDERRGERALQYLELSRRLVAMVRESGQDLAVGPASPFWFDGVRDVVFEGASKPLSEHVMDVHDYVALMDYRDFAEGPDGILYHAESEVAYADRTGKALVVGVEASRDELDKVSFYEEGLEAMEAELAVVVRAWGGRPGFGGIALHHYRSLRALEARPPGNPTRDPTYGS
jgi:hypothetical protein